MAKGGQAEQGRPLPARRRLPPDPCWPRTWTGFRNLLKLSSLRATCHGLPLQAPGGQVPAGRPQRRPHRPVRLPQGRDPPGACQSRAWTPDGTWPASTCRCFRTACTWSSRPTTCPSRPSLNKPWWWSWPTRLKSPPGGHQRLPLPGRRRRRRPTTCSCASRPRPRWTTPSACASPPSELYYRSPGGDGRRLCPDQPQALANTCEIASRIDLDSSTSRPTIFLGLRGAPAGKSLDQDHGGHGPGGAGRPG